MREIVVGHRYALDNLKSEGETELQFYQDPDIHGVEVLGPSTQEVLRACIARVTALNNEQFWEGNQRILRHLRCAIAEFEARAIVRKAEKNEPIERTPTGPDGHVFGVIP